MAAEKSFQSTKTFNTEACFVKQILHGPKIPTQQQLNSTYFQIKLQGLQ